jgi:hypothetical protein
MQFTLMDLLILIAGIAVGCWIVPEDPFLAMQRTIENFTAHGLTRGTMSFTSHALIHFSQPVAVAWTITVLVLALRRGPSLRHLAIQPGFIAGSVVALTTLIAAPANHAAASLNLVSGLPLIVEIQVRLGYALMFERAECGVAVSAAWLTLILGRRWRPQRDWIDRAGRCLGGYWIAMIPITWITVVR